MNSSTIRTVGLKSAIVIAIALCTALLLMPPAIAETPKSKCPAPPHVDWWGNLTNTSMIAYVKTKFGGDWAPYIDRWEGQAKKLQQTLAKNGAVKMRKSKTKIKGAALKAYIAKVDQRVSIIRCLADEAGNTPGTMAAASAGADFDTGLRAYEKGEFSGALSQLLPLASDGDARAQFYLGLMFDKGEGVHSNPEKAFSWWKKAAGSGDLRAQHAVAKAYIAGRGVKADPDRAIRWLNNAAAKGHTKSQYTLGKMYAYGSGVKKDPEESFGWILRASKAGYDKAQYTLGKMYRDGFGTEQNDGVAAAWFLAAARQGYAKAQRHIATRLATGKGVEKNPVEALKWYMLAARTGNKPAKKEGKALAKRLSKKQRAAARALAAKWESVDG